MSHLRTETPEQLKELNDFLGQNNYVNGDLPGPDDVRVFDGLKCLPNKSQYPETHFWYLTIQAFTPQIREAWSKSSVKQQQKKDDDVDLFGDDDESAAEEAKKLAEKKKAEAEAGKKKKTVIAKTVVIFEVKVYEAENVELLESLASRIRETVNQEGLVWGKEHKVEEVAYGAKKLKMNMVIEDDKVLTDDVFDKILAWDEEVQSVDVVTMQKV